MRPPRPELVADLAAAYPGAGLEPLLGDASTRRFFRMRFPAGESRIVMDYGAPVGYYGAPVPPVYGEPSPAYRGGTYR